MKSKIYLKSKVFILVFKIYNIEQIFIHSLIGYI